MSKFIYLCETDPYIRIQHDLYELLYNTVPVEVIPWVSWEYQITKWKYTWMQPGTLHRPWEDPVHRSTPH